MMEDVLVDVLECSVCLNQLDSTARVLPCQHTFCLGCLTDIVASRKELRCPECRVLVMVPIEELPCNILLMRILEGIKSRPQQIQSSTSTPATTDFSYILNLYNTSSVDTTTSTVGSLGPGPRVAPTSESLLAIGSLSLTTNNTGFSNHVLNTIANISNASSFNSSSPQKFSNVAVAETNLVSSSASFVNVSNSSTGLSATEIPMQSLGYSHSSSYLLDPTIASVFSPSPSIVNSSVSAVASNNPFLDRSSDLIGNSSCSLTSSPIPFMINQNQPLSLHGGSQFLSLGSSSVQQQVLGFPPDSGVSLSAAASPTRFLQQNIQQLWQSQPIGREQLGSNHNRSAPLKHVTQYSYLTPSSNVDGSSNLSFSTFFPNTLCNQPSASLISRSIDLPNQTLLPTSQPSSSESQSSISTIFSVTSTTLNSLTTTTTSSLLFSPNLSMTLSSSSASVLPVPVPLLSSVTSSSDLGLRGTVPDLPSHSAFTKSNSSGHTSSFPSASVSAISFSPSAISSIGIAENVSENNGINNADYNINATANVGRDTADTFSENVVLGDSSSLFSSTLLTRSTPKTQNKAPVHARALYNYKGDETRDLSFMKGAVISLVRSIDQHWYLGESGGRRGFVPASYVEPLPREDLPQGIALYDFKMTQTAGGGQSPAAHCLSFNKGDVLLVLRHVDHNWAEGSVCDRVGIFPLAFVQLNGAAAALLQPPTATTNVVSISTATTTTASSASTASVPSTPLTLARASPTTRELNARNVAPAVCRSPAAVSSSTNTSIDSNTSNTLNANLNNEPPPLTIPANTGLPTASKGSANNMAMLYVARFSYQPQKADEVALTKGGLYAVTQRCHDGWFKGRCLTTHHTGVFPGNYLHPARGQTIADYLTRRNSGGAADGASLQRNSNNDSDVTSSNRGSCPTSASPARSLVRRSTVSGGASTPPRLAPPPPSLRKRSCRVPDSCSSSSSSKNQP